MYNNFFKNNRMVFYHTGPSRTPLSIPTGTEATTTARLYGERVAMHMGKERPNIPEQEQKVMQDIQHNIYRYYINPAAHMFRESALSPKQAKGVDKVLENIITKPYNFIYREDPDGTKFVIEQQTKKKLIEIKFDEMRTVWIDKKGSTDKERIDLQGGGIWSDFTSEMKAINQYSIDKDVYEPARQQEMEALFNDLPFRLARCIKLRSTKGSLNKKLETSKEYKLFKKLLKKQPKDWKEIMEDSEPTFFIAPYSTSQYPGIIFMMAYDDNGTPDDTGDDINYGADYIIDGAEPDVNDALIATTYEGYLLEKKGGKWVFPQIGGEANGYENAVQKRHKKRGTFKSLFE